MLIIPKLIPTTKLYGIYGPLFNPDINSGNNGSNPLLVSPLLDGATDPLNNIYLMVWVQVLSISSNSNTQIDIILYTEDGSVYTFAQYRYRGTMQLNYFPCAANNYMIPPNPATIVLGCKIDIFKLLREGKSTRTIEVAVNSTLPLTGITPLRIYWGFTETPFPATSSVSFNLDTTIQYNRCATSLGPNKKTITLNKSTGFVFTVT